MFPFLFCFYNDEPIFSLENGAQVLRDLVDALFMTFSSNYRVLSTQ